MTMLYPSDPCIPPHPIAETIRERLLAVLLQRSLPYLVKVDLSPSTNADLRDLIRQIEGITRD